MAAVNTSPPASPGSALDHKSPYESHAARSPGYPSPPSSPPVLGESAQKQSAMGPPPVPSQYTSMAGASVVLQQPAGVQYVYDPSQHPPSKLATGGQSHAHRPVSAMPTPTEHSSAARNGISSSDATGVFASMNGNQADRRASAHPTMSSAHSSSAPSQPIIDATTSQAISSGIPITSPAALSYFAAHPRRQQVHFGNYLLLQTLGEGEFGKVKLGVHKEWGEEVAVKLIKRDKVATNAGAHLVIDDPTMDPAKMTKVEREIQVLKDVRHPNIVRLYEVIESDRYIGIVLEYASGGELFDHILAHKYLKEDHACRLFAQLISGVSYLHQKKIIHRDLKLENLLLDRNRNVIITDFGFANNFESRRDDLMATSCGSPCYAAPELVVQDGLYAGSAVDIWSCGVILYAMLAGYLPFDDDPANPDGDNINLLYKYILATPLSFPDYITAEPRDLLSRMLVPDPNQRATLEQVMQHSWLRNYRELFKFSVDDLERAAMEQQSKKRQVYRQQMMYQQQLQEQQRRQQLERSQSMQQNVAHLPIGTAYSTNSPVPVASHRQTLPVSSTVPDRLFEPISAGAPAPLAVSNTNSDIFAVSSAQRRPSGNANSPSQDAENRVPAAQKTQRHTIQLEYDGDQRSAKEAVPLTTSSRQPLQPQQQQRQSSGSSFVSDSEKAKAATEKLAAVAVRPSVLQPVPVHNIPTTPVVVPDSERIMVDKSADMMRTVSSSSSRISVPPAIMEHSQSITPESKMPDLERPTSTYTGLSANRSRVPSTAESVPGTRIASNPLPASEAVSFPPSGGRVASAGAAVAPAVQDQSRQSRRQSAISAAAVAAPSSPVRPTMEQTSSSNSSSTRHRKGMSTDRFFLSRLLGSSNNVARAGDDKASAETPVSERTNKRNSVSRPTVERAPSSRRKAMSLVVGRATEPAAASRDRTKPAEPTGSVEQKDKPLASPTVVTRAAASRAAAAADAAVASKSGQVTSQPPRSRPTTSSSRQQTQDTIFHDGSTIASASTAGPSSNAAKKVMDWFRKKSLARGTFAEQPPLGPFERSPTSNQISSSASRVLPVSTTPSVIVTGSSATDGPSSVIVHHDVQESQGAASSVPSSRSTSGTHSETSEATGMTQITVASDSQHEASQGAKSSASTVQQQATPKASLTVVADGAVTPVDDVSARVVQKPDKFDEARLRYHLGAVDQSALTSRSPIEVLSEVQHVLFEMGIDFRTEKDEDFKLECVRRKRAKTLMSATQGFGQSIRSSVFPPSQADVERSSRMSHRDSLTASASTPNGGSLRSFLRKGSYQATATSPRLGGNTALPSSATTSSQLLVHDDTTPAPIYGDYSVDGGQEIRFSVEVTRIKNLHGLYSLDIRRMKGNLWAYKFVYQALLDRCQLGSSLTAR